jgi:O-antigen/teichoic acid export membrane protein
MVVSSMANMAIRIGSVGLLLMLNIQLARSLGPENFGLLAFTFAWVQVLVVIVQFGLPTAMTRSVTLSIEREDTERLHNELLSAVALMVLTWSAIVAFCWLFWELVAEPPGGFAIATPALLSALVISIGPMIAGILRGLGLIVKSQLPDQIVRPGLFCLALALVALADNELTPARALWLQVATTGIAVFAAATLLWRRLPPRKRPQAVQPFKLATGAVPFLLLSLIQVLSAQAAILMLGQLVSDAELAHFRVATQVTEALNLVLIGFAIVIGPMITKYHDKEDWANLQHILVWAHRVCFLILLIPVLTLVVWSEAILNLVFGASYAPASQAMQILLVGKLVYALIGFSGLVLAMSGEPKRATYGTALSLTATLLIMLPLVMNFGTNGAALAQAIGGILNAIICIALLPGPYRQISALSAPLRRRKQ